MYDSDLSYEDQGVQLHASNDVVYDNKDAFNLRLRKGWHEKIMLMM